MTAARDNLSTWIGRTTVETDLVTPRLIAEFRATMEPHLADIPGLKVPLGLHWCLAPFIAPMDGLGLDGHPRMGGFLPPVQLPRRMWAGGEMTFTGMLLPGDEVTRRTTIRGIEEKQGKSGALCFVTVEHEYTTQRGLALREIHNIVYRAITPERNAAPAAPARPTATTVWRVSASPTLLFRYSAMTFNGHRIHYDRPYAATVEGYPDLVVHGPLQATLMLNLAVTARGKLPTKFSYRGVAPLIGSEPFEIVAADAGGLTQCWTERPASPANTGGAHMLGEVTW